jgi:hypothetical protein
MSATGNDTVVADVPIGASENESALLITYAAIVTMAVIPIYIGSFRSMTSKLSVRLERNLSGRLVVVTSPHQQRRFSFLLCRLGRDHDCERCLHVSCDRQLCAVWSLHALQALQQGDTESTTTTYFSLSLSLSNLINRSTSTCCSRPTFFSLALSVPC